MGANRFQPARSTRTLEMINELTRPTVIYIRFQRPSQTLDGRVEFCCFVFIYSVLGTWRRVVLAHPTWSTKAASAVGVSGRLSFSGLRCNAMAAADLKRRFRVAVVVVHKHACLIAADVFRVYACFNWGVVARSTWLSDTVMRWQRAAAEAT